MQASFRLHLIFLIRSSSLWITWGMIILPMLEWQIRWMVLYRTPLIGDGWDTRASRLILL